jgi:Protein of unknown function (DUF3987)
MKRMSDDEARAFFDGIPDEEWPEPGAIKLELSPVKPLTRDMVPGALRDWIFDSASRKPCPPDLIAVPAVVMLGSLLGARCGINPKARDDWQIVPNLWGGIVGPPSSGKSPAISEAKKPFDLLVAREYELHAKAMALYEIAIGPFNARKKGLEAAIKSAGRRRDSAAVDQLTEELKALMQKEPAKPVLKRLSTNDSTIEKLSDLLVHNPQGLLIERDELTGLLLSWTKKGHENDRAFYLEAWNGNQSLQVDRITRGSIYVTNVCLSIFGGIQPDKLRAYIEHASHELANDGLLQRFQILVYPDNVTYEWIDNAPDFMACQGAYRVYEAFLQLNPVEWGASLAHGSCKFPYWRYDQSGQRIFKEWMEGLHRASIPGADCSLVEQHLAKYSKLFSALALIFHLVDCVEDPSKRGPITAEAANRAKLWCEYLETHARRCYGLLTGAGLLATQKLAEKIKLGKLSESKYPKGFTARDVYRHNWQGLRDDNVVQAALNWLEGENWLYGVRTQEGNRGRPTVRYFINPRVFGAPKR